MHLRLACYSSAFDELLDSGSNRGRRMSIAIDIDNVMAFLLTDGWSRALVSARVRQKQPSARLRPGLRAPRRVEPSSQKP